jgi:putative hydrolase of the HAD superfamily
MSEAAIWQNWLYSTAVREFESGGCNAAVFAAALIREMNLDLTEEAFLAYFQDWPKGLFPGAAELLLALQPRVQLACLSNTNELHWRRFSEEHELPDYFDINLPSFKTGHMKPDRIAYQHAVQVIGQPASSILFLDDNETNVLAARDNGLLAEMCKGPEDAKLHLKRHGLL